MTAIGHAIRKTDDGIDVIPLHGHGVARVLRATLVFAVCLAAVGTAHATVPFDRATFRREVVANPAQALAQGRALLDRDALVQHPDQERELLWLMGRAALLKADDVALAEINLRLGSLAEVQRDPRAQAYAGFLRAWLLLDRGKTDAGLGDALRAAALLQGRSDPATRGLVAYQLCNAYSEAGDYHRAQTQCDLALDAYSALHDSERIAGAENLKAEVLYNLGQIQASIALLEDARQRYRAVHDAPRAGIIDDNLARLDLEQGKAATAIRLSRRSLAEAERAGRVSHMILARANIARAESALGQHAAALADISADVTDARKHHLAGMLPDLLDTESRIAEAAGQLKQALNAARAEADEISSQQATMDSGADVAALEARFATREKELRIGELERANRIKALELVTAQADAARHQAELARQQLKFALASLLAVGAGLMALTLFLLLRGQRQHGAQYREQALRDSLTGLENRRAFFSRLQALVSGQVGEPPHALLLLDLDHFKQINDRGGHPLGDAVLVAVARCLEETLAGAGQLARIGGEEFGVLCTGRGQPAALALGERLRAAVAGLQVATAEELALSITLSIGVAVLDTLGEDADAWVRRADRALYAAKARGRNTVVEAAAA